MCTASTRRNQGERRNACKALRGTSSMANHDVKMEACQQTVRKRRRLRQATRRQQQRMAAETVKAVDRAKRDAL